MPNSIPNDARVLMQLQFYLISTVALARGPEAPPERETV